VTGPGPVHLPFTESQFFDVFRQYNEAVWPAPVVLTALALSIVLRIDLEHVSPPKVGTR